jgi:hypothetical protein
VSASPFGAFNNSIQGCNPGGSGGGCGVSTLTFDILNFQGFASTAYQQGNTTLQIFFAGDILDTTCSGGCTGNVGATFATPVPLPPAVALYGLGLAGLGWLTRRRLNKTMELA